MDRWKWSEYEESGRVECPTCDAVWDLSYIKPYGIDDFRHCPNCGERLGPPLEGEE